MVPFKRLKKFIFERVFFLNHTPLPVTSSFIECLFTVTCTIFALKFQSGNTKMNFKEISLPPWPILISLLPICIASVMGHTLTQISLEFVQVSFTHTIKSLSPVFTMVLAYLVLGDTFNVYMALSVIPIVCGVLLSSSVEININMIGCGTALLSCFTFCFQNIYSKIIVEKHKMDPFYLLIHCNVGAALLLLLLAIAFEWSPLFTVTNVVFDSHSILLIVGVGFFHFLQSISAISFLAWASSVSYSIANTFKRVFVIILSIIYFGNEVTLLNYLGILLSLIGIILYTRANDVHKANQVLIENQGGHIPV